MVWKKKHWYKYYRRNYKIKIHILNIDILIQLLILELNLVAFTKFCYVFGE